MADKKERGILVPVEGPYLDSKGITRVIFYKHHRNLGTLLLGGKGAASIRRLRAGMGSI